MPRRLDIDQALRALQAFSREDAYAQVEDAAVARIHRRRRPSRIARRSQARCARCNLFTANPARACESCGFLDTRIAA